MYIFVSVVDCMRIIYIRTYIMYLFIYIVKFIGNTVKLKLFPENLMVT